MVTGQPEWIPAGRVKFYRKFRHACTGDDGITRLSKWEIKKLCAMIRSGS